MSPCCAASAAGLNGILVALAQAVPWQVPLAGSALLVCGVLSGVAWRRLGWGAFVLLALLSGYIGFSALMIVQKLMHLNAVRGWPWLWLIVAMVSAVGGGIEFAHVFRSGRGEPHA